MKQRIVILLSTLFVAFQLLAVNVYAEKKQETKEPNQEDQIRYIKGRKLTEREVEKQKKHEPKKKGEMALPKGFDIQPVQLGKGIKSKAAARESYDARKEGFVTEVKDQDQTSWCWSYSVISSMETSMIKNKVKTEGQISTKDNTDLSEAALAYYFYNRTCVKDPLSLAKKDRNIYAESGASLIDHSGNSLMASLFLETGMGIKKEDYYTRQDAYDEKSIDTSKAYSENEAMVKNIYWIDTDEEQIKSAILQYGSVVASVCIDGENFNYDTAALYNPSNGDTDHSVTIVGWDDTYSRRNFNEKPGRNGAWIVKNSWSSEWGDNGYFYMSYEDQVMMAMCTVEMQAADTYGHTYFYDGSSGLEAYYIPNGGKAATEFTAKANGKSREKIEAVSFTTLNSDIDYSIQIYKGITSDSNPVSGTKALKKEVTGTTTYSGTYTVPIKESVVLDSKERYSIVITLKSKYMDYASIGIENDADYGWITFDAVNGKNQSFIKENSKQAWSDLSKDGCESAARIKVHTNNSNYKKVIFKKDKKVCSTQYVAPGKAAKAPTVSKEGYQFVKWDKKFDAVNEDLVVNAVFTPNRYTVTYNANYGKGTMKVHKNVAYDTKFALKKNRFTRKGFTFIGWNTNKKGKGIWYTNKQKVKNLTNQNKTTVTLYAQWSKNITIDYVKSYKKSQMTVKHTKTDSYQTGYEIVYSTDKKFKKSKTKTCVVKGYKNKKTTIKKLAKGKKYYVKVRTYRKVGKKKYYGAYTSVKKVTIKR